MQRLLLRELKIAFRHRADIINPLWFFLIIVTLFPLSIGPESTLLA
ncbi:heme exporter protein CcmB, partial [Rosenbergiella nectarea]